MSDCLRSAMRSAVTLFLSALAAAAPHAQPQAAESSSVGTLAPLPTVTIADPTVSVSLSTSLNIPTTLPTLVPTLTVSGNLSRSSSRHHYSHWEPIPIFSSACNCPDLATVQYPCWATDSLQVSGDIEYRNNTES